MLSKLEPEAKVCDMKTEWCRENGTHLSRGNRCSEPRISHTPYFPLRTKAHCAVWIRCGQFISYSAWGLSYCLLLILKLEIFICLFIFTTFSRKICCPPLETWLGVANLVLKWQFSLLAFDVWSMTSVCGNVCLCLFSQNCIATHESNGIDIITALILNDINPLGKKRMDLVLELKASRNWKQKKKNSSIWKLCCVLPLHCDVVTAVKLNPEDSCFTLDEWSTLQVLSKRQNFGFSLPNKVLGEDISFSTHRSHGMGTHHPELRGKFRLWELTTWFWKVQTEKQWKFHSLCALLFPLPTLRKRASWRIVPLKLLRTPQKNAVCW